MDVCVFRRRCHGTHRICNLAVLSFELLLLCVLASYSELLEQDVDYRTRKLSLKGIPLLVFADCDFDAVPNVT